MLNWLRKLWPVREQEQELPEENPPPTHPDYETFHITADKGNSKHVVDVLMKAEIRLNETVWNQIGHPEYVIEVHKEDFDRAGSLFWEDVGPGRTFTSSNAEPGI